jgi:serine/threonine protein kinase
MPLLVHIIHAIAFPLNKSPGLMIHNCPVCFFKIRNKRGCAVGYKKGEKLKTAFDTYTVEEQRGAGGSGEVYTVCDSDGLVFAAKILDKGKASSTRLKRFRNALEFCARGTHPNIVRVLDSGLGKKGAGFYVMPLYAESLRHLISRGIAPERALPYFGQVLDGVEAGHLHRICHLDLKPENLLHDTDHQHLLVADFGTAHLIDEDLLTAAETNKSEQLAKFPYAAPEQKMRGQEVDQRADIYTLGLILNEMFTGGAPQGTEFQTIASISPDYAYLDDLVSQMTSPDPAERPPSIDEIKKQLIARGNEFFSRQRLNSLRSEVLPESEAGDSFLANPIRIISADYSEGTISFKLNANPTPNWIAAFKNPRSAFSFYTGAEPETFTFSSDAMNVKLPGDANARQFVQYTKSYIDLANAQYREHVIAFHQRQMQAEREALRRQVAEEERRLRILTEIRNAI